MTTLEILLILLQTLVTASVSQLSFPSAGISQYCHLYTLSNKGKQFILFADETHTFKKSKPKSEWNGDTNYMFTFLNGMSRYDKDGNLIYSTIRLVDTKSKRTLCQTRKNRRKPVLKKARYSKKYPRKCQYREHSRIMTGQHKFNYHFINDAYNNYLQWRNWGMKYSNKRVRKMRKRVNFVPEISFHKDCDHEKITFKKGNRRKKPKGVLVNRKKKGRKNYKKYHVRINNERRKKRNPHTRVKSSFYEPETFQKSFSRPFRNATEVNNIRNT